MRGRSAACRLIDRLYSLICVSAFAFVRSAVKAEADFLILPAFRCGAHACRRESHLIII